MKFIVRTNCEYAILIEADSPEEAMKIAEPIDVADWGQAWSDMTAEEE